jgi:hypothetical protein
MSRSYKHHNFVSNTCSGYHGSEKKDKQRCNRKHRSKCNQILKSDINEESFDECSDIPVLNEIEHKYTWTKDGKSLVAIGCPDVSLHFTRNGKLRK